jgi:hypothetical protein
MELEHLKKQKSVLEDHPELDIIDTSEGDTLLTTTQKARLRLIGRMTQIAGYEQDPKTVAQVLKALDGIDKQALGLKKIASDEGLGNRQAQAVEAMMQLFNDPDRFKHLADSAQAAVSTRSAVIEVPDDAESVVMVNGEMDPIGSQEDYATFMKRMQTTIHGEQE